MSEQKELYLTQEGLDEIKKELDEFDINDFKSFINTS